MAVAGPGQMWRHKTRGSTYEVLARATMQCADNPLDDAPVVIYRDLMGYTWVRPESEFLDGRFELVE